MPTFGGSSICSLHHFPDHPTDEILPSIWQIDRFYSGGQSALPFQGVCQGNGVGPAIWLATSMVLMDMVHENGHLATFYSPISHQPTNSLPFYMLTTVTFLLLMMMELTLGQQ